jgi:glycosyltransferase involved in cell wall biosynthesis
MPSHSKKVGAIQRVLMKGCARFSSAIITSSECSKKDIMALLGVPEGKVSVVHDGCDHALFNAMPAEEAAMASLRSRLGIDKPYVLHHGTIQPRKNLRRLIEAYRLMLARNRSLDLDLVLAGQMGWASDEVFSAAIGGQGRGNVILAGVVSESDLPLLIKGAELAVVPSLYEGFSLPMVESMACGTPTIVSRTSCLPEISGNVLAYFDPLSIDDMATCMQSALTDSQMRARLRQEGIERASQFTWERCAQETLDVLMKAGKAARN